MSLRPSRDTVLAKGIRVLLSVAETVAQTSIRDAAEANQETAERVVTVTWRPSTVRHLPAQSRTQDDVAEIEIVYAVHTADEEQPGELNFLLMEVEANVEAAFKMPETADSLMAVGCTELTVLNFSIPDDPVSDGTFYMEQIVTLKARRTNQSAFDVGVQRGTA